MEWQVIDSAPKDGRELLLYQFEPCAFASGDYYFIGCCFDGVWADSEGLGLNPTHWMPIPAPPAN